jgi:hypothetical protein
VSSEVSKRLAMVVSPNEAVQYTCSRRGARAPQAVADGAACGGTPARETTSSKGKEGVLPGELASGCPDRPTRGLHPRASLRRYPTVSCGACLLTSLRPETTRECACTIVDTLANFLTVAGKRSTVPSRQVESLYQNLHKRAYRPLHHTYVCLPISDKPRYRQEYIWRTCIWGRKSTLVQPLTVFQVLTDLQACPVGTRTSDHTNQEYVSSAGHRQDWTYAG